MIFDKRTDKKDMIWEKVVGMCFIVSVLTMIFLLGYDMTYEPKCEREHLEVIDRNHDSVPSKEFAVAFAGASIGLPDNWETLDDFFYTVECSYNDARYEWIVVFTPTDERATGKRIVGIRRDLALITIYQ